MQDAFEAKLNELLVDVFDSINKVEEQSLRSKFNNKLSISEYHMLESVGKAGPEGRTVTDIGSDLGITKASVTVGVNKLVKKGFLEKIKCSDDGRVVYVMLTREGRKVNAGHRLFHEHMVRNIMKEFDEEEQIGRAHV